MKRRGRGGFCSPCLLASLLVISVLVVDGLRIEEEVSIEQYLGWSDLWGFLRC